MIGAFRQLLSAGRGSSESITVPPMDGALKPNQLLEFANVELAVPEPDNLARDGDKLLFSSAKRLFAVDPNDRQKTATQVATFQSDITALVCNAAGGYAVGLDDGQIIVSGGAERTSVNKFPDHLAPTAMAFDEQGDLFVCSGSAKRRPMQWKRDLMERNETGSVWKLSMRTGEATRLASGLAYPYGIAISAGTGEIIVTESWKHRLLAIPAVAAASTHKPRVALDQLPGYPARIVSDAGGYWLCVFAPRGQLIELILREPGYRTRMMATVHPDYWMAPAISSGRSFLEPLQLGSLRTMGTLKPWAPTRSYGLVIRLDADCQPVGSAHSRSDGTRHGVTSCVQWGSELFVASKGGSAILSLPAASFGEA